MGWAGRLGLNPNPHPRDKKRDEKPIPLPRHEQGREGVDLAPFGQGSTLNNSFIDCFYNSISLLISIYENFKCKIISILVKILIWKKIFVYITFYEYFITSLKIYLKEKYFRFRVLGS